MIDGLRREVGGEYFSLLAVHLRVFKRSPNETGGFVPAEFVGEILDGWKCDAQT